MRSGATGHRRLAAAAGLVVVAALLGLLFVVSWPAGLVVVAAGAVTMLAGSEAPRRRTQLAHDGGAAPARRSRRRRHLDIGWATSVIDMGRAGVGSAASRARRRVAAAVGTSAGPPGQRGEAVGVVLLSLLLTACAAGFVAYTMVP